MSAPALRSLLITVSLAASILGACAGNGTRPQWTARDQDAAAARRPDAPRPVVERRTETEALTCFGRGEGDGFGTRVARTPVMAAPDGGFRAYAEVEALAFSEEYAPEPGCVNYSRLHLAAGSGDFELVLSLSPFAGLSGNSIRLVDWSPDGRRLLLEAEMWAYGSEFENPDILVLHAGRRYFEALDMGEALGHRFDRDCFLLWRALGFLADGAVAVETRPAGELYGPSCEEHPSRWRIDERGGLDRLPADLQLDRYGQETGPS